eukprot:5955655-Prymnesium_polylepis.1
MLGAAFSAQHVAAFSPGFNENNLTVIPSFATDVARSCVATVQPNDGTPMQLGSLGLRWAASRSGRRSCRACRSTSRTTRATSSPLTRAARHQCPTTFVR